ncbi:hypothetical protein VKT23_016750 [Stygiomarasmius scandens]|uniref:Uncharacterized protein n=1 Tax=Marasmiellus scandens TaxID=2682957 RepID=A0ABR1IWX2_9AGAR
MTRRSARLQEKSGAMAANAGTKRKAQNAENKQPRKRAKKSTGDDKPSDILTLTRCSPELYTMLHSASSLHIWRNARLNVEGLPPPPPDLNEIQYAILAFDAACHACGRTNCENVLWDIRVRCCKNCTEELVASGSELRHRYGEASQTMVKAIESISKLSKFIPSTKYSFSGSLSYTNCRWTSKSVYEGFLAQDFDQLFFEYEAIVAGNNSLFEKWTNSKLEQRQKRLEHVQLCQAWHQSRLEKLAQQKDEIRRQRKSDIEDKLIALGWGPKIERVSAPVPYSHFSKHRLVKQPVKLTDEGWEKIAPTFIDMMKAERERREEELRIKALRTRYLTLRYLHKIYPVSQSE